ncbi:uncharacterized protein LOC122849648 [Aphidius gifuensis]|uniref:uncharacterized protein LOC122849648 n=1 Tax=Aphidius gifuensis TaxID=684658 RepID=UPI001CDC4D58|nr:uncharacterized protein LOC122849648 [Aphidius gifuensis]
MILHKFLIIQIAQRMMYRCKNSCGCRKAGLRCSQYCKKCKGEECGNDGKITNISLTEASNYSTVLEQAELEHESELEEENNNRLLNRPKYTDETHMRYASTLEDDISDDNNDLDFDRF